MRNGDRTRQGGGEIHALERCVASSTGRKSDCVVLNRNSGQDRRAANCRCVEAGDKLICNVETAVVACERRLLQYQQTGGRNSKQGDEERVHDSDSDGPV